MVKRQLTTLRLFKGLFDLRILTAKIEQQTSPNRNEIHLEILSDIFRVAEAASYSTHKTILENSQFNKANSI